MKIDVKREDTRLTVSPEGHIDTVTAPQLQYAISLGGVEELVLNFAKVDYISSAGIRVLLMLQKTMNLKGRMTIVDVKPEVRSVFEMTGVLSIFSLGSSEATAERHSFPCVPSAVDMVRRFVAPETTMDEVMVAIDEIVSNIVKYSGVKMFAVEKSLAGDKLKLVFIDEGVAFDPLSLCGKTASAADAGDFSTFGMGLRMVKNTMDSMSYVRQGNSNQLTVVKKVK